MNTKIAVSLLSIVAALSMMGGAAFAAFSSTASNVGNTFGAGSLTMTLNGQGGSSSTPLFTVTNASPSATFVQPITLANTGSANASSVALTNVGHSSTSSPDLGDKLTLDLFNDVNSNGILDIGTDTQIVSAHVTSATLSNVPLGFGLNGSSNHKVIARITFDSDADNTYQGTNSTFSLNFQAN